MDKHDIGAFLHGKILLSYGSIRKCSKTLQIRERPLNDACRDGTFESLSVADLVKLSALLPDQVRESLRRAVLP